MVPFRFSMANRYYSPKTTIETYPQIQPGMSLLYQMLLDFQSLLRDNENITEKRLNNKNSISKKQIVEESDITIVYLI